MKLKDVEHGSTLYWCGSWDVHKSMLVANHMKPDDMSFHYYMGPETEVTKQEEIMYC